MAKLINFVLVLSVLIIQVYSNENSFKLENSTDSTDDFVAEKRFILSNFISRNCKALLNTRSPVLPGARVTLTRLANDRVYYFSLATETLTFDSANKFCKDHGMHLVTINSALENLIVFNEATRLKLAGTTGAWIGMRDVTGGGNYRWVQPKVGRTPTFFEPLKALNGQCALYAKVAPATPDVAWVSDACDVKYPFICEMELPCAKFV